MGVYPERLKYAVIEPVHKKGKQTDMGNCRPISVVTGFAEIFKILNDHVVTYKILPPQQYGFLKGLSTEDAIFKLTRVILTAWNRKQYAIAIFCDISNSFDCVSHELLLMKLQYFRVQGVLLQ
jgi:hypothetical protein